MSDRSRARKRTTIASGALLALLVAPLAVAGAGESGDGVEGRAAANGDRVVIGERNRSSDETGLISTGDGYSLRLSNTRQGAGGGAIFGCRAAPGQESCVRANNLTDGLAFSFRTGGSVGGNIEVKNAAGVPFTTNATGRVPNLNADKVDGLDAAQLQGQTGPAGPAGATGTGAKGATGANGAAGPAGPAGSARAYARVTAGISLTPGRTKGFTAVNRPTDGLYCLTLAPGSGIDEDTVVATTSVDWLGTVGPEGNASAMFSIIGCADNQIGVRTQRIPSSGDDTGANPSNNVAFNVAIP